MTELLRINVNESVAVKILRIVNNQFDKKQAVVEYAGQEYFLETLQGLSKGCEHFIGEYVVITKISKGSKTEASKFRFEIINEEMYLKSFEYEVGDVFTF